MRVTVLGGGTWGTTLACLLYHKGHRVRVWEYAPAVVEALVQTRRHPKLPDLDIPRDLPFTADMAEALPRAEAVVCAVPAPHVRQTCRRLHELGYAGQLFVICAKGIEQETHALLYDVARAELGEAAEGHIGLLSGPSHAEEVSRGVPTAVTATAPELKVAEAIRDLFMSPRFRIYTQTDVVGVELAASLKNVIAIACGISDGLGFGDNSKAALITRALTELTRIGARMGARPETFFGLAGIGDLVVTCMSGHSRNRNFGFYLGQGLDPAAAQEKVGMVVEGFHTLKAALELAAELGVELPICEAVGEVVLRGARPMDVVSAMMMRDPKSEMEG